MHTKYKRSVIAFLIIAASLFQASPISAQTIPGGMVSSKERDRAYNQLAVDVAALEKRLGIIKRVVRLVQPTVVHIEAKKNREYQLRYGSQANVEEAGSGVLVSISNKSYILTNRHVVKYANTSDIKILLNDGRLIHPTKVWEDKETDVAVMLVVAKSIVTARIGDSSKIEIGDFALAVGSPFGLSQSVTYGIVSAKGRHDLDLGDGDVKYQNFFQTDAAINPGNSGGPLINLRGEVVGINTAIASSSGGNEGIGFSIPINTVLHISKQLIKNGKVVRAFLGVSMQPGSASSTHQNGSIVIPNGVLVTRVTDNSPAKKGGIEPRDIVLTFDGIRIKDDLHLSNVVALTEIDRDVTIVLVRGGQVKSLKLRLGDRAKFDVVK